MPGSLIALSFIGTTLCGAPGTAVPPSWSGPIQRRDQAVTAAFRAAANVYGRRLIESERPLKALRDGPLWKSEGSLLQRSDGGVVVVTLNAKDGTIVDICHGK